MKWTAKQKEKFLTDYYFELKKEDGEFLEVLSILSRKRFVFSHPKDFRDRKSWIRQEYQFFETHDGINNNFVQHMNMLNVLKEQQLLNKNLETVKTTITKKVNKI